MMEVQDAGVKVPATEGREGHACARTPHRIAASRGPGRKERMRAFFLKPYRWATVYGGVLTLAFLLAVLDAFVIPKTFATPEGAAPPQTSEGGSTSEAVVTDTSYQDDQISIQIETQRVHDTAVYVADIVLADASLLKTALAQNTYGRNIKAEPSEMAEEHGAILAINGDYYGFRESGVVLRNGVLYRDSNQADSLLIDAAGDLSKLDGSVAEAYQSGEAWQAFTFGPTLVEDGEVAVDARSEVSRSRGSNPRTAVGQVSPLHYIWIVSDGRTQESAGLTLLELAELFTSYGCQTAYNLDGGGSSAMVFNGAVINTPTDGRSQGEREVSDIVYIGYQ
jgi:exopolysaccharide biosynthesis protein